jgi:hypothetical protein
MNISSIISAIGNNSTPYPLLVRDCCIEVPSKILIARKENLKESREKANDATRERFIDEYVTSAIWLGGIPATEKIADKFISKSGYNPLINIKLFNKKTAFQSVEANLQRFKNISAKDVQEALADLVKVQKNKPVYEKLLTKKFIAATAIPTAIMGFVLPPLNFALTKKIKEKRAKGENMTNNNFISSTFTANNAKAREIFFTGSVTSTIANLRTIDKMAISDGGLTIGRVSTSRNKDEAYVNAFRMIGSMILNFVTPVYIAKGLDGLANKLFKINVNLDPIILDNKEFINQITSGKVELPKSSSEKDILDFLDSNPKSLFSQFAAKLKKVTYLKSGYRDPRKFVDVEDIAKLKNEFERFIEMAKKSANPVKFANKAKYVKGANILANIGISSFLLAFALPKAQYAFNKLVTGSYSDPGLRE